MKELKFRTLDNLTVPDELMERLLAIPEAVEQKRAVPLWRKPRVIAAAASLVLVTALSLALVFATGGKTPVIVKPSSTDNALSTEIVWSTNTSGETVATEIVIVPADPDRQDSTQPTEPKSGIAQFFERIFGGSDHTAPTNSPNPTSSGSVSPTTKPQATETGGRPAATTPSPTNSGKTDPTAKPSPTVPAVRPTELPTEEDIEEPTEGGVIPNGPHGWDSTEAPTEGQSSPTATPWENPTEPTWEDPTTPTEPKSTESRYKESVNVYYVSAFTVSAINREGGVVYCRIYDSDGNLYGDSDLYSDQHVATLTLTYNSRTLSYTPRDYGILPEDGCYRYEFYTGSGKSLVTGSAYLSAS
ncbi:MAG: hypothetical protein IJH07_06525 [Ruminococcus sp.]|nr:hypothetical protein [Ruminococcus sp.]